MSKHEGKFKIGDKVVVTKSDVVAGAFLGDIGTIVAAEMFYEADVYSIDVNGNRVTVSGHILDFYNPTAKDMINSPDHYTDGGIETIDFIRAKLSPEEFAGYLRGNILKYMSRAGKKTTASEDYKKALVYLQWLSELKV